MFVIISGCSGGGKSTLIAELARRGQGVVEEPARRILAEDKRRDGNALPLANAQAFARRTLAMSIADHKAARGLTFFDRGIVDAAVAMTASGDGRPAQEIANYRYDLVVLAPPWPEIYKNDEDRRHSFEKALRDYERVRSAYVSAGYAPIVLPRASVADRADFLLTKALG